STSRGRCARQCRSCGYDRASKRTQRKKMRNGRNSDRRCAAPKGGAITLQHSNIAKGRASSHARPLYQFRRSYGVDFGGVDEPEDGGGGGAGRDCSTRGGGAERGSAERG